MNDEKCPCPTVEAMVKRVDEIEKSYFQVAVTLAEIKTQLKLVLAGISIIGGGVILSIINFLGGKQ